MYNLTDRGYYNRMMDRWPSVHSFTYDNKVLVLINCFPELHLPTPKKRSVVKGHWNDVVNQKNFLDNLATKLRIP